MFRALSFRAPDWTTGAGMTTTGLSQKAWHSGSQFRRCYHLESCDTHSMPQATRQGAGPRLQIFNFPSWFQDAAKVKKHIPRKT